MVARAWGAGIVWLFLCSCAGEVTRPAGQPVEVSLPPHLVPELAASVVPGPKPSGALSGAPVESPEAPRAHAQMVPPKDESLITIAVGCRDNPECRYRGEDLVLEIQITSRATTDLLFPLMYLQRQGPTIVLFEPRTKRERSVPMNPVGLDTYPDMTLKPGHTVAVKWGLGPSIEAFGRGSVDLVADITIDAVVKRNGTEVWAQASTKLHIGGTVKKLRDPRMP